MRGNVWRYEQRGPQGWALVLADASGALAIFSDWGNYTCKWNAFGPCFLTFLAAMPADVLPDKVCPARSVDHDATGDAALGALSKMGLLEEDFLRQEAELIDSELYGGDDDGHHRWLRDTKIPDADLLVVYGPNKRAVAMSKQLWPGVVEAIKTSLRRGDA